MASVRVKGRGMEVDRTALGNVAMFRLKGRLDSSTSPALEFAVLPAIQAGAHRLVFDFSQVEYVSSAGLRVVLLAAKQARVTGGGFAIFGMSKPIRHVFDMSGFSRIIALFDTEAEAVSAAGAVA